MVDGAEYLIVSQNEGTYYALAKISSKGNNFTVVEVSLNSNSISVDAATDKTDTTKPFAITLKKSDSNWNFFEKLNNQYINGGASYTRSDGKIKNNNYFKLDDKVVTTTGEKIYNGVWSISVSTTDNTAEIKNQNNFIVSFNHQGTTKLIASYQSSTLGKYTNYSKVQLYKKITAETLTTSAGGYATYSADYAVNYSDLGLTAYTLTVDETNKTVTAKEFTGVVPAGGAVLVKGDASKAYTLTPATTEGDATFATALKTGATKADGTQYGFTSKSGTPAFAQVVSGLDIPAKKGYIVLNGASAAKYAINFDGEATGIHTIEAASAANAAMYNLAGQRVDKAYKGIVIVNGKKYLNK